VDSCDQIHNDSLIYDPRAALLVLCAGMLMIILLAAAAAVALVVLEPAPVPGTAGSAAPTPRTEEP
jgi:hypothetical protein